MSNLSVSDQDKETSRNLPSAKHTWELQTPDTSGAEMKLADVKAIIQLIPVAGGPIAELVGTAFTPAIRLRYEAWLESVFAEIYRRLAGHDELLDKVSLEKLFQSEAFLSAFLQARQYAIQTTQQEKLEALRNAVANVALGDGPDESLQTMFLDAISALTPWHIRLLSCIADPVDWARQRDYPLHPGTTPDPPAMFEAFYRGHFPADGFHEQVLDELYSRGLATNDIKPRGPMFPASADSARPRLSDFGRQFLKFISTPESIRPTKSTTTEVRDSEE